MSADRRFAAGAVLIVLATLVFYGWTAKTSDDLAPGTADRDKYNLVADAFLAGHTYVAVKPPAGLLRLRDPQDPRANRRFRQGDVFDLSLYDGRLYSYFGPTPALLLFVPFRLLGVGGLPHGAAVLLMASLTLLELVWLMRLLVARWLPRNPVWAQLAGLLALAFGDLCPFLLRGAPGVSQVAQATAMALVTGAMLLLALAAGRSRPHLAWFAGAGLALGLAFGCRPPLALTIAGAVVVVAAMARDREGGRARPLAALLVPFAACLVAYGVYNAVRFDNPLEFGLRYQLGGIDTSRSASLSFLPPSLWYFLLAPLRLRVQFPFLRLNAVPNAPFAVTPAYNFYEPTGGLLTTSPIVGAVLFAPLALRGSPRGLRLTVYVLAGVGAALLLTVAVLLFGTTERYLADFVVPLLVAGLLCWYAALARLGAPARRTSRRIVVAAGATCVACTIVVGFVISLIGQEDLLRSRQPALWASLERRTEPVAVALASLAGHPVLASIDHDMNQGPHRWDRLGVAGADVAVGRSPRLLRIVSPRTQAATLVATLDAPATLTTRSEGLTSLARGPGVVRLSLRLRRGLNDVVLSAGGSRAPTPARDVQLEG